MGKKKGGEHGALLGGAQFQNVWIVRRPLGAMIGGEIFRTAVLVVLAIGKVVALVIGGEIRQRETVMRGEEINAGPGAAAEFLEQIGRAKQASREFATATRVAAPEAARSRRENGRSIPKIRAGGCPAGSRRGRDPRARR